VDVAPEEPSFSTGFPGAGSQLTLNGHAQISGAILQLTDRGLAEASSAFYTWPVKVSVFTTQFAFQLINPNADGFTFTVQGARATALGFGGAALGYGPDRAGDTNGIRNSVAVKFDLYNNQGEGPDSTGLYLDGVAPTNASSVDLSPTGINLHSGHVFDVTMAYDGATLKVNIVDTVTGASATQSYAVNIPAIVGGQAAYVGFTGATGGMSATQNILEWTYASRPVPPPAPTGVTASAGAGQVFLAWSGTAGASYNIYRSTQPGGEGSAPWRTGVTATSFSDTGLNAGVTYYYEITTVGPAGESARASEVSATPPLPAFDFTTGFTGSNSFLSANGSAKVVGSVLELTDGRPGEAGSSFYPRPVGVSAFSTKFWFQLLNPNADGFTFTIQGAGAAALGLGGGALGYGATQTGGSGGIPSSVAIKFDLYNNQGEGADSTGLSLNGAVPTNAGSIDLSHTGINLHSGHVFAVALVYDGTTLKVTITDTVTGASATQSYVVNIPAIVGNRTAYVGFTAGTGGLAAIQEILGWSYTAI
jgi:hypothetical protein